MTGKRERTGWILGLRRSGEGAVAVEFAVCIWVLVVLMVGILEFGRAFYHHRVVANSIRDAGRYLARVDDPTNAVFQTNARNLAMRGTLDANAPPLLSYWDDPATIQFPAKNVDNSGGGFRGGATIPIVRVEAEVPYTPPVSFVGLFGIDGFTFSVAHEQRYIGN